MIGCGPGGSCCGSCSGKAGLAGYDTIESVLRNYVIGKVQRGERFYISDDLNSQTIADDTGTGMGFAWAALFAKVAATAKTVAAVAGTTKALMPTTVNGVPTSADNAKVQTLVLQKLQAAGVTIPPDLTKDVTQAVQTDVFGNKNVLILGGLAAVALIMMLRK